MSALSKPPPLVALDALLGTVLDQKYELTAHLATGGMGAVFKARHVHLRKDVAVKVLRPELSMAPDLVERFRREAEIASALDHDNIVKVTDFGRSEEGLLYLVMELLAGESLFERIRRDRRIAPPIAVRWLFQICAGLEEAHRHGVVHRDLKPENVFLAHTASGREVVKLLDFGIAKFARAAGEAGTATGIVVGTPEYLSPEQAMGLPVDGRADVYTVGLIAFRMLAGQHPFRAEDSRGLLLQQASTPVPPLGRVSPDLAAWPDLCAAVATACAKDPQERPSTAAALGDLFVAAMGPAFDLPPGATPIGLPVQTGVPRATARPLAPPDGRDEPLVPPLEPALTPAGAPAPPPPGSHRRRRLLVAAAVALLVAATALGAVSARHAWRARPLAEAQALLAKGDAGEALALAGRALADTPGDPALLLVRVRALELLPGRQAELLEAAVEAQAAHALEPGDYRLLAPLLADRKLAEPAARLLREAPPAAVPEVAALARSGPAAQRLRALAVLKDLRAEDAVDRVGVYISLLADADCDVRRTAARRLGELGDRAALPALRAAASAGKNERKFLFFGGGKVPACGAPEAGEAVKRIVAGG